MYPLFSQGSDKPLPSPMILHAGNLTVTYLDGNLRYIKAGEHEVLRMIYAAVRDHNWKTAEPEIRDERIETTPDSFKITYDCQYRFNEIIYRGIFSLTGTPDSRILCSFEGEALADFESNRIGFCILHPVRECSGKPCEIIHSNGTTEKSEFPLFISPHQPFKDVTGMKWETGNNSSAVLNMEGEIFETEDHRNWIDDSFKTYGRPLSLPFPFQVRKGDRIAQKITLIYSGKTIPFSASNPFQLTSPDKKNEYPLPVIGVSRHSSDVPLSDNDVFLLKRIPVSHYRAEIHFNQNDWKNTATTIFSEARRLEWTLELALLFSSDPAGEAKEFCRLASPEKENIRFISILSSITKSARKELIDTVIEPLKAGFPFAKIGAGTGFYFTELNRHRSPAEKISYLTYSINPQVHAFDNLSLIETLDGLKYTVSSACQFSQGRSIHISPVSLKPRKNPDATKPAGSAVTGQPVPEGRISDKQSIPVLLPPDADIRQPSLFGAAWTLGCIKSLAVSGAGLATFYETTGIKGIMMGDSFNPCPDIFRVEQGWVYPVYHVLHEVLSFKADRMITLQTSHPLQSDGMLLVKNDHHRMIIWNYGDQRSEVAIPGPKRKATMKRLNPGNVEEFMKNPLLFSHSGIPKEPGEKIDLEPFEIISIDW